MGLSGISPLSLLLILAIVIVLFGTKRLKSIGQDLGAAVGSFREGLQQGQNQTSEKDHPQIDTGSDTNKQTDK